MSKMSLSLSIFLLFLLLPSLSLSQMEEIKEYTVIKGDTLWDISDKELRDNFLWPKIWKENPDIKNPDRIYPGQSIRIPLYLLKMREEAVPPPPPVVMERAPVTEEIKAEKPVKKKPSYLVDMNTLIASGYISDRVPQEGEITGSPEGKNLFGNDDLVYVTTKKSAEIGDKFYIIRAGEMVTHPSSKDKIGYVIEIVGIATIEKFESGESLARITQSFQEAITGDLLDPYYEIVQPLAADSYRKPEVAGYVIASRNKRILSSSSNIVFIDKGTTDQLQVGDLLRTVAVGRHRVPNGIIQIIRSGETTSTAIVRESKDAITVGNIITQAQ